MTDDILGGGALFPPPGPTMPVTGDPLVDDVVAGLSAAMEGSLDDQVLAAQRMDRVLTDRLGDLDGE